MNSLIRDRGLSLAAIVLLQAVVSMIQTSLSYTIAFGPLSSQSGLLEQLSAGGFALRVALHALSAVLWILNRKRALFRAIVIINTLLTFSLLLHTYLLFGVLLGKSAVAIEALMLDVVLMAMSNILIFSIWYWVIDPPGVGERQGADVPWEFLFPQRGGRVPYYESWVPRYADYLYIAFTNSFAFSPTDAMPLSRRAKMLMLLQAVVSVVTLTGIAGSAINILAGGR